MAGKDFHKRPQLFRHCSFISSFKALSPLLFLCMAFWLFCFFLGRSRISPSNLLVSLSLDSAAAAALQRSETSSSPQKDEDSKESASKAGLSDLSKESWNQTLGSDGVSSFSHVEVGCDLSSGRWVRHGLRKQTYDENCPYIFKGWNCLRNNKSNSRDFLAWRWQPWKCELPQLDANLFLERFKHKRIGFVGDSLNRNMYVSLVCSLKQVSGQVKKWRPVGADKAVTFLSHNLTLAYHRTNLLARYGRWEAKAEDGRLESLGYKEGFRVDVDIPQSTWAEAPRFHDVLILNTGHWWWAPEKFDPVKSPMLFFEGGEPIIPTKSPEEGLDLVLKHMLNFVEREMPSNGLKILRTQSPRHFEGGDWNEGGNCKRSEPLASDEMEAFFALDSHGPNVEMSMVNRHLKEAVKGTSFQLLNISYMSSFRADAHPSESAGKLHEDCMHWCLPGVTDFWNDMLSVYLLKHSRHHIF